MQMRRIVNHIVVLTTFLILFCSCGSLKAPIVNNYSENGRLSDYTYVYITPTKELTSSAGGTYGNQYGVYGSSTTKSVNPSEVVAGLLFKRGYVQVPEITPEIAEKTLIVNYGESGRRNLKLGYTIEVTIQFITAKEHKIICSTTAEGQGSTEADDIRQAITRAVDAAFK